MAKSNEFKVGDLVRLKSGGPNMTVERIVTLRHSAIENGRRAATVVWDANGLMQRDHCPFEVLERAL